MVKFKKVKGDYFMNIIFISPTFPRIYYQFPRATKNAGMKTLGIAEDHYDSLSNELKESLDDYYQVSSLENYEEVYRAVAYFSFKYGKIDWIESNNEYWLAQDAKLRTDFNITTSYKTDDLQSFKFKSGMKAFYEQANVKVARYHMVSTLDKAKGFIKEVGFPVIVKPDNGVGASSTYKISNNTELEKFFKIEHHTQFIMEEFITGNIISYDGIANSKSEVVFETSHLFTDNIMDIVNNAEECVYYTLRDIPEDIKEAGRAVIKSFKPRSRFFHCEFFRLTKDKPGLGKKGDLVGLEVNMRPPGGYTTDMMNFAYNLDIYKIYADVLKTDTSDYQTTHPYFCCYIGRRDNQDYKYTTSEIYRKYNKDIVMHERMPAIIADALGNEMFMVRFSEEKDVLACAKYILKK